MNRILDKLRSGKGASITFALLLFLVCAVLSAVIVTTASTAAGRMSNMAEADQRYYSVTSACELLKELLDGKTVSIVKVTVTDGTYAGTYTNAGTYMVPNMGAEQASVNYVNADYKLDDPDKPILKASIVNAAAYARYNGGNNNGTIAEQAIVISGDELEGTAPIIKETMGSDGKITITVSKASGINKNPFAIKMVFSEDRKKSPSATKTITMDDGTTVDVTTEATSFTWHFKSVNVVSATGAGA